MERGESSVSLDTNTPLEIALCTMQRAASFTSVFARSSLSAVKNSASALAASPAFGCCYRGAQPRSSLATMAAPKNIYGMR